jgi:uncharacterized protein involved in cysteine biosynthesis
MALAPHFLALVAYTWFAVSIAAPFVSNKLLALLQEFVWQNESLVQSEYLFSAVKYLIQFFLVLFFAFGYSLIGTSVVNILTSPIHDELAKRCFESVAGPLQNKLTFSDFLRSLISETSKFLILLAFLVLFVFLPFLLPGGFFFGTLFAPIIFGATAFYNGWDIADRTLAILNLPFKKRLKFAKEHPFLCVALGIWTLIPLVGNLFAFCLSGAGGIVVAKTYSQKAKAPL